MSIIEDALGELPDLAQVVAKAAAGLILERLRGFCEIDDAVEAEVAEVVPKLAPRGNGPALSPESRLRIAKWQTGLRGRPLTMSTGRNVANMPYLLVQ